jgi:hypothetical protein
MCFAPKVPKEDPAAKAARDAERERLEGEKTKNKEQALSNAKRIGAGIGTRSLISSAKGSGFGRNYFG